MSGHSKWATTKRQKASTDEAKSRVFANFSRLIALESKKTAGDISSPGLSSAISRAKSVNMPKDSIDRAVAKGISKDADTLEQIVYEFYGPSGIAIVVDALTDNRNRTTQEVKHLLSKQGYELSTPGSASWAFTKEKNGKYIPAEQTILELSEDDEEKLTTLLTLLDEHEDVQTIYTNARGYENTRDEDSGD